jgi:biopolymer transport protein ExbB/TolQ
METLIKADIFFFISSIASVVLTILLCVVLYYFIKAGKNLYQISEKLQEHFQESEEFVLELKDRLEENMIFRLFFPPARSRRRASEKAESQKKQAK